MNAPSWRMAAATSSSDREAGSTHSRLCTMPTRAPGAVGPDRPAPPGRGRAGCRARRRGPCGGRWSPGAWAPKRWPHERDHPGLVVRHPVLDPVAQPPGDHLRVPHEGVHRGPARPAAAVLERLRQVPVVQRGKRPDAPLQHGVHQALVEIESLRFTAPGAAGDHARPGDGEPVVAQAERAP